MTKVPFCPKCGKVPMVCSEAVLAYTDFDVKPNRTLEPIGYHNYGDHIKLTAECACGHVWTVRSRIALALLAEKGDDDGQDSGGASAIGVL